MKLLGWMHRKLNRNTKEPQRNFTRGFHPGNPSTCFSGQGFFDEQKFHVETTDTFSHSWNSNKVETISQEESYEPFTFLAIGTLGSELMDTYPPTPTFPMASEHVTNEQAEIQENDLKFINYELEKFLEVESEEIEIGNDSSSQRSSLASIITICNEWIEGKDSAGYTNTGAFPPQNYLLGSSIHGISVEPDKEKAPFEGLFKKKKIVEDNPKGKREGSKKQATEDHVTCFMKRMKKKLHSTSKSTSVPANGKATAFSSITRKLAKGLKVFDKKVHPEGLITTKQLKLQKGMAKYIAHDHEVNHQTEKGNGKNRSSQAANVKQYEQNTINLSSNSISKCVSKVNSEHWIRSDADYLVLEL